MNTEDRDLIVETMNSVGGDRETAAELLGISREVLSKRICSDRELTALYGQVKNAIPDAMAQMVRDGSDLPEIPEAPGPEEPDSALADVINIQNREILSEGFKKAGIKETTLDKMQILGEFEQNAGKFLVGSMDLMHRLIVYCGVQLFEDLEYIRGQIRAAEGNKERLMWQRTYNVTLDQMQKINRDVQSGTLAMAKLTPKKPKGDDIKKPGFRPRGS